MLFFNTSSESNNKEAFSKQKSPEADSMTERELNGSEEISNSKKKDNNNNNNNTVSKKPQYDLKSRAKKFFEMLRIIIQERIAFRKEIKDSMEKFFEFHPVNKDEAKFFHNFLSISNDYIRKILNKDLCSHKWNEHYFDRGGPPCIIKSRQLRIVREKKISSR
jgi:hypothetical protein